MITDDRPDGELTPEELAARWRDYAEAGSRRAMRLRRHGQVFDAEIQFARAQVRRKAAALLRKQARLEAARRMHDAAFQARQHVPPPLMGMPLPEVDRICLSYTCARTWQACAWALDPSLPEVQREWPE